MSGQSWNGTQHRYLAEPNPSTFKNFFTKFEPGVPQEHCRATPLFDLTSVHVQSNHFRGLSCVEIYGTIVLIDDHQNEFYIFDCKHRNAAKSFILDPESSVILENFQPRGLPAKFCLLFKLKRRLHAKKDDIVIFDDYLYIDCTKQLHYDRPQVCVVDYKGSIVSITYTIFQCALLAEVGFIVEKTGRNPSGVATITGCVNAHTRGLSGDMSRTLVNVSCQNFNFGNYIPLSTMVVPAYSSLRFQGNVSVNGEDICCDSVFEPFTLSIVFHEKEFGCRPYRIRFIVFWLQGATSLPEGNILEYYTEPSETVSSSLRPTSKLIDTNSAYYFQPRVRQYLMDLEWDVSDFPTELLEIFSISVCAYDHGDPAFSLRGKVKCFDHRGHLCIFDSDIESVSTSGDIVKLVPDLGRAFLGPHLGIVTELTDNQGREISFGSATYDFHTIGDWHDKRICSVIRGQNGFAAVHYTIFSDAVLAKLSFEVVYNFESGGASGCNIHGSINTSYSNFSYSTHYAKTYFRSTLFEKEQYDAVKLAGGEKVPLSKSIVAVPVFGLLVVEAIIYVQHGKRLETLMFKETFSPAAQDQHKVAKSTLDKSFGLFIDVEWVRQIPLI